MREGYGVDRFVELSEESVMYLEVEPVSRLEMVGD